VRYEMLDGDTTFTGGVYSTHHSETSQSQSVSPQEGPGGYGQVCPL
jgi:hypothetical protein